MNPLREAAQQALEALEFNQARWQKKDEAITALREAIAQAEKDKKLTDERIARWREEKKLWDAKIEADRPCWHRLDELRSKHDVVVEALTFIADHDLKGTDLMVAGHMAHGFIGRARAALNAAREEKE